MLVSENNTIDKSLMRLTRKKTQITKISSEKKTILMMLHKLYHVLLYIILYIHKSISEIHISGLLLRVQK